jgi:hypothetical protein
MQSRPTISWKSRVDSQHYQIQRTQCPVKTKRRNRQQIWKTLVLYVTVLQSIDNKWENRKVRPLCLNKHYATKANIRVGYSSTHYTTLALDGGQRSASHLGHLPVQWVLRAIPATVKRLQHEAPLILMPGLRSRGATQPLPHTPSWRAQKQLYLYRFTKNRLNESTALRAAAPNCIREICFKLRNVPILWKRFENRVRPSASEPRADVQIFVGHEEIDLNSDLDETSYNTVFQDNHR